MTFFHPLQMQFRKIPYSPNDRPLHGEYITTFVLNVSHQTVEIFTFKN